MKILAINGSLRGDNGHTRYLIDRVFAGATSAGAACDVVTLATLKINRCISCGTCNRSDHYLRCVFDDKDDVRSVFDKMRAADILIFATPVYIFTVSALLKTLVERIYGTSDVFDMKVTKSGLLFHHVDPALSSKPFVALVCCDSLEPEVTKNAVSYFKTYSRFNDAPLLGLLVRNGGRLAGHGRDTSRQGQVPRINRAYEAFEQAGRELATNGRLRRGTERRASGNILPIPSIVYMVGMHFKPFRRKVVERARVSQRYDGEV
jgi:multimeric flavodoxin WrbA